MLPHQSRRVRYDPADRLWLAALSRLIPGRRWHDIFPVTLLAWHRRLHGLAHLARRGHRPRAALRWADLAAVLTAQAHGMLAAGFIHVDTV